MAKVLITGAGGFLGAWVTRELLAAGHEVRAADIAGADLSALADAGAQTAVCDVTRPATVRAAVEGVEAVAHVAGLFDLTAPSERLWAVNAEGARVMARAAIEAGVERFVMISTSGVYGRCGSDTGEDAPKKAENPYERTKWAGEKMAAAECKRGGLPFAALRPTLIYGPGGRYGLAPWVALLSLWRARGARKLHVARGGPRGHHVHVEDVARAVALLVGFEQPVEGAFNVADDTPITGHELVEVLAAGHDMSLNGRGVPWFLGKRLIMLRGLIEGFLDGWNPKLGYVWSMLVAEQGLEPALSPRIDIGWLAYMSQDHTYDTSRLKALGFTCKHPDVRQGLSETIRWYREQRWIP